MRTLVVLAIIVHACGCSLPHVDPQPRDLSEQTRSAVRVDVTCSEAYPFASGDPADPSSSEPDVEWYPARAGTGVAVSERHVLTAAHLVACPAIPVVHLTLRDGRVLRAYVERDDAMFGDGRDIARLELASAGRLGLRLAPPVIAPPSGDVFAEVYRPWPTPMGEVRGSVAYGMTTVPGDSGAGVYDRAGRLVGLVSSRIEYADGTHGTRIVELDHTWLDGT